MKRWNIFIWKHYLIKEKRFKDGIILKKNKMKRTQGERIIYPVGEEFDVEKVVKDTRSEYERINITFINHHCERCSLRGKYTKSKFGREITHIFQMEEYQKEARRNVKSGEELKLMFQRNNETEGTFGDWKS